VLLAVCPLGRKGTLRGFPLPDFGGRYRQRTQLLSSLSSGGIRSKSGGIGCGEAEAPVLPAGFVTAAVITGFEPVTAAVMMGAWPVTGAVMTLLSKGFFIFSTTKLRASVCSSHRSFSFSGFFAGVRFGFNTFDDRYRAVFTRHLFVDVAEVIYGHG
jgi:hypothetical protein